MLPWLSGILAVPAGSLRRVDVGRQFAVGQGLYAALFTENLRTGIRFHLVVLGEPCPCFPSEVRHDVSWLQIRPDETLMV